MRKTSPLLSALISPTTQEVLSATVLRPDREWYLSDLASNLGVRPSSLQRTLAKLSRAGILQRRENGNRVYYRADPSCPILAELSGILTKTSGIAEPLRDALAPLARKIILGFIHGSVAEGRERSESDIDLILVGEASNGDVAIALRPLQERLGREVNVTRYTLKEFAAKVSSRNHFLSSVLKQPRIFLIGGEHELEQVAGRAARGITADEQARA
jgi:DNA-binding transcriptional ArsR family regulator